MKSTSLYDEVLLPLKIAEVLAISLSPKVAVISGLYTGSGGPVQTEFVLHFSFSRKR